MEDRGEDEVGTWLMKLSPRMTPPVHASTCNCSPNGSTLATPYARNLGNGLRELRFHLRDEQRRITFWITPDRRIVLLTTFRKQRQNERREVDRAHNILKQMQQEFDK